MMISYHMILAFLCLYNDIGASLFSVQGSVGRPSAVVVLPAMSVTRWGVGVYCFVTWMGGGGGVTGVDNKTLLSRLCSRIPSLACISHIEYRTHPFRFEVVYKGPPHPPSKLPFIATVGCTGYILGCLEHFS